MVNALVVGFSVSVLTGVVRASSVRAMIIAQAEIGYAPPTIRLLSFAAASG
jgi:hypothetical protein